MKKSQKLVERLLLILENNRALNYQIVLRCLIVMFVISSTGLQSRSSQTVAKEDNNIKDSALHLILATSRKIYRVGSPIEVSSYIENRSERSFYYIGRDIGSFFGKNGVHYIELRVQNEKGKEPLIGRGVGDGMWEPGTTIKEKLARSYVLLSPETFYGVKARMELPLKPGKYKLIATYHEVEATSWSAEERKALVIPVWTKQLVSNPVMITVQP